MCQVTYIISDLHLAEDRPGLYSLFDHFMQAIAPKSDQLFVLCDLFEVWLGDDCLQANAPDTRLYKKVIDSFSLYTQQNKPLFFIHGNRDFLLGDRFEKQTGGQLLREPHVTELSGLKTALMHGDVLCTDDIDYQKFRQTVRNKAWQDKFLSLPIDKRIEAAFEIKQQSKRAQKGKAEEIMDVSQDAVVDFFGNHSVDCLIHGHTHRQKTHHLNIGGKDVQRVVLSDWNKQGFYLSINNNLIKECFFSL